MPAIGSLINLIADRSADPAKPEVGQGATIIMWSDRQAATIVDVSPTGHRVRVQEDHAIRTDENGMSDCQSYRYERNEDGIVVTFSRRKDGTYRAVGGTTRLLIGVRDQHFDYSF